MSPYNEINGSTTKPLGRMYPDDCFVESVEDYSDLQIDLDENDNSIVIDFAADHGKDAARGASVRFKRESLCLFIHMLQAAYEFLESDD